MTVKVMRAGSSVDAPALFQFDNGNIKKMKPWERNA